MPISNAKFMKRVVEVVVDVEDDDGNVEPCLVRYRPNAMTPRMERALADTEAGTERFVEQFCQIVQFMDVAGPLYDEEDLDEDGNPREVLGAEIVPMEPEYVSCVSLPLLSALLRGIMADMTKSSDPKGEPAPPTSSSKTSRNGSFGRKRT